MSFATPIPDMSNRPRQKKASGGGRPKNGDKERIRTVAWFNAVAFGIGLDVPGAIGRRMQAEADARSLPENHDTSKRWNRYKKGQEVPSSKALNLANEVVPGSTAVFQEGPGDLWLALWNELSPRFYEDEVAALLAVAPDQVDSIWLAKVIVCWRSRAAIMRLGSFENMIDGLYEAVFIGLSHQEATLRKFGVWELVCENVRATERHNLGVDPHKRLEIEAVGGPYFSDPVENYLSNPLEFTRTVMEGTTHLREILQGEPHLQ